jgi:hypothetical protein
MKLKHNYIIVYDCIIKDPLDVITMDTHIIYINITNLANDLYVPNSGYRGSFSFNNLFADDFNHRL